MVGIALLNPPYTDYPWTSYGGIYPAWVVEMEWQDFIPPYERAITRGSLTVAVSLAVWVVWLSHRSGWGGCRISAFGLYPTYGLRGDFRLEWRDESRPTRRAPAAV